MRAVYIVQNLKKALRTVRRASFLGRNREARAIIVNNAEELLPELHVLLTELLKSFPRDGSGSCPACCEEWTDHASGCSYRTAELLLKELE